jgi:glycosyltransferase involved in cell wall biosynthesis
MADSETLVSVVMPTFDRASVIRRALQSVADQTYPNIEIVVIDDGSTDHTDEVIARFVRENSTLMTYLRQENSGCASARNRGLRVAKGEFLTFLDSDDAWLPTAAESMANALVASGADFTYSPAIEIYADGSERVNYPVAANRPESFAREHFRETNVRNGAFMFRRRVLSDVHGLDESLKHNEDSDFIQRVAVRYRAVYCSSPTVQVHHHDGNKSRNRVAIYNALIKSAENLLNDDVAFRAELGDAADRRMSELKSKYVEALIVAGAFEEARQVVSSSRAQVSRVARLASRTRSTTPMAIRDRWNRLRRSSVRKLTYVGTFGGSRRRRRAS